MENITNISQLIDKPKLLVDGVSVDDYELSTDKIDGYDYIYFLVPPTDNIKLNIALNGTANAFLYKALIGHPNFSIKKQQNETSYAK